MRTWFNAATVTPGSFGSFIVRVINANNLLHPVSGSVLSPTGYTKWTAFYQQYRVHGCSVRFEMFRSSLVADDVGIMSVIPSPLASITVTPGTTDVETFDYAKWRHMQPLLAGNSGKAVIKTYMGTKKMFAGINVNEDDYAGTFATGPTIPWFFHLSYTNSSAVVENIRWNVLVTQYVTLYNRVSPLPDS